VSTVKRVKIGKKRNISKASPSLGSGKTPSKKKNRTSKRASSKKIPSKRKVHVSRHAQKKFEDPLEISLPPKWMGAEKCREIISLRKLQYRMWGWTVALAILLLLSVTTIEILSDYNVISSPTLVHQDVMRNGDVLAIFIIALELTHGFSRARNKALYLRQNWIAILAILPLGMIVRIGRAFEGLAILEEIASLKTLQMAGKFGELRSVVPALEMPSELSLLVLEPFAARGASLLRGTASVFFAFAKVFDDILLYLLRILK